MKHTITIVMISLGLMFAGGVAPSSGAVEPMMISQPSSAPALETVLPQPPFTPLNEEVGDFSSFNSLMHDFNLWVWQKADVSSDWLAPLSPSAAVRKVGVNLLLNYVNEPVSMLSWVVAGDFTRAAVSAERFWINTTQGGYIVLPFVGPRTVRDGLADFVLFNAVTYAALAPVIGFPPSVELIAVVEVTEEAGRIAFMRQIDHGDDLNTSQAAVRKQYLSDRRKRCDEIIAGRGNGATNGARP